MPIVGDESNFVSAAAFHHSYGLGPREVRSMDTVDIPQGPGEVSTPGPGALTDQTPLVKAGLEAHNEQSEKARPEIEVRGEGEPG